jgi:hypothetical protein
MNDALVAKAVFLTVVLFMFVLFFIGTPVYDFCK